MLPDKDAEEPDAIEAEAEDLDDVSDTDEDVGDAEDEGTEDDGAADSGEDDHERGHEGDTKRPDKVAGRAKNDFGKLRERARAAEERARQAEERALNLERSTLGRTSEETKRAEQERISLMTADEKLDYYRQQDQRLNEQRFGNLQFQMQDQADSAAFDRLCERNPAIDAVSDEVIRILTAERAAGRPGASREIIAKYVIGDRALKNAGRAKGKAQKRADTQRSNQTARPADSRGKQSREGGGKLSEAEARKKRLEGLVF